MTTRDDVLRTLDAYVSEQVQTQSAADAAVLQALKDADAKALSDLKNADAATLAALQKAFDDYKAANPDGTTPPPPPPPPSSGLVLGMNFTHTTTGQTYESRAKAARIYVPRGETNINNLTEFKRARNLGINTFVISWKDTGTSSLGPMLASIPDGVKFYGISHHEPEDDISSGGFSLSQWKSWQNTHMPLVRQNGGIPAVCFMAWTLQSASGRKISDYSLPNGLVDAVLYDYYPTSASAQSAVVSSMKSSRTYFGASQYGIGEYGVVKNDPTGGANIIKTFKSLIPDASIALYWSQQVDSSKPDYHFSDTTANAWFG